MTTLAAVKEIITGPRRYDKERDAIRMGNAYTVHVSAMSGESLHSKADIAQELAARDIALYVALEQLRRARVSLEYIASDRLGIRAIKREAGKALSMTDDDTEVNVSGFTGGAAISTETPDEFTAARDKVVQRLVVAEKSFEDYYTAGGYQYGEEEKRDAKSWFVTGHMKAQMGRYP